MAGPLSRLAQQLSPRVAALGARLGRRLGDQIAPAARLARIDLNLARSWSRHVDALGREAGPAVANSYTRLVLEVAEVDLGVAKAVAHSLPDRLAALPAPARARYLRVVLAVAKDRVSALPLVIRTLPDLLERLDDASLARYLARGLALHAESPRKAESYLRVESGEARREADRLQRGLALDSVRRTLALYARAHCGRDVQVVAGDGAFTDGRRIHLPAALDRFGDDRDFLLYRVLTAQAAGFLEFGTLDLDLAEIEGQWPDREEGEVEVERLLRAFQNPSLARDLFTVFETWRVEARVQAEYPGVARDMARLDEAWRPPLRPLADLAPAEQAVEHLVRLTRGHPCPKARAMGPSPRPAPPRSRWRACAPPAPACATASPPCRPATRPWTPCCARSIPIRWSAWTVGLKPAGGGGAASDAGDRGGAPEPGPSRGRLPAKTTRHPAPTSPPRRPPSGGPAPRVDGRGRPRRGQRALDLLDAMREARPPTAPASPSCGASSSTRGAATRRWPTSWTATRAPAGGRVEDSRSPPRAGLPPALAAAAATLEKDATVAGRQQLYPEWDCGIDDHKPDWVRVTEYVLQPGSSDFVEQVRREHGPLVSQLRRAFEALRPDAVRKVRGLPDGDEIDLDRAIQARIEYKAGGSPDGRIYMRHERAERDVTVAFLVDMSSSTNEVVGAGLRRVIDIEKEALVLISEAVDAIGDQSAIWGFSGYGRDQVAFYIAKDFKDPWDHRVAERIGRMSWKMENRDGAAIRHASALLAAQPGRVKLLLLLSDGKPLDCGCDHYADRYAQDDTRNALQEARKLGIHPFCITIDPGGPDYLADLYGEHGYTVIDRVEALPQRLPLIYRRLTR